MDHTAMGKRLGIFTNVHEITLFEEDGAEVAKVDEVYCQRKS